jgi:nuclease S1
MIALAAPLVVAAAKPAAAWSPEVHRIVADVAEQYLEPEPARQVRALLALENATTLAEVSTWADAVRAERPDTMPWHFVGIPVHPPRGTPAAYDPDRDCPAGACVVAAIDRSVALLADTAAAPGDRLEALKFVVGLVADIHQPLDCADDGEGRGEDVHLVFLGRPTNLHALWDHGILEAIGVGDERAYALRLVQTLPPARLVQWRAGTPVAWANESYSLGRLIYGSSHEARALAVFYEEDFVPVLNGQLQKAGIRLAMLLNRAL